MIVDYYREHRIDVNAIRAGDRWNAAVRIRHTSANAKPHVEQVTNYKLTADHAERSALIWAQQLIDSRAQD